MIKIGIFTTDFNIRQIALWRLINTGNDYSVKMYIFTYDSEVSESTIKLYTKQFKGLEFEIIPAAKGKIRLPQNFLEMEKVNVAVLYDYWYNFERQIVKRVSGHLKSGGCGQLK